MNDDERDFAEEEWQRREQHDVAEAELRAAEVVHDEAMRDMAHRFEFHPAPAGSYRAEQHRQIRTACLTAAVVVVSHCPGGREQSLAITKLEEAMMWANAGIARDGAS